MNYFLTFGGGSNNYRAAVARICRQAYDMGVFNHILGYTDEELHACPEFWREWGAFVEAHPRGFGYWIWKPWLILYTLKNMQANDVLIYCDAGCELVLSGKPRLEEYIAMTRERGFLGMRLPHTDLQYTRKDMLEHAGLDRDLAARGQVLATTVFVSKSGPGVRMIERWYALCSHDGGALLLDRESGSEQNVGYVEHRHDQSALSCVVKKLGGFTIPDETYFGPNWRRGAAFPIQARRNRTGIPYHI